MKNEPITTARELCYQAFCANLVEPHNDAPWSDSEKRTRFDNWWEHKVWRQEHRDCLYPEHSVFINGKRYVELE